MRKPNDKTSRKKDAEARSMLDRCRNLMKLPPKPDRNRQPPQCRLCEYYQPEFRYRKSLYACCPYGKKDGIFREVPLKKEKFIRGEAVGVLA